jgi:hypothetical protein
METMTLPNKNQKLDKNEVESISNAVKDAGIRAIHPEKMEAYAEYLVAQLNNQSGGFNIPRSRTGGALEE